MTKKNLFLFLNIKLYNLNYILFVNQHKSIGIKMAEKTIK